MDSDKESAHSKDTKETKGISGKNIRLDFKELSEELKEIHGQHQFSIWLSTIIVYSPLFLFWTMVAFGCFPKMCPCGEYSGYRSMIGMLFYPVLQGVVANIFHRSEKYGNVMVLGALRIGYRIFLFALLIGIFDALLSLPLLVNFASNRTTEHMAYQIVGMAFTVLVELPLFSIFMIACCVTTIERLGVLASIRKSYRITKGNLWRTIAIRCGILILFGILYAIIALALSKIGQGSIHEPPKSMILVCFQVFVSILSCSMLTTAYVGIYFKLREHHNENESDRQ